MSQPLRLAFVDLETTGATAAADRITEIGIVQVDADGVREWSSLVNPEAPIPDFIQRLTGISDEMVADAPTFGQLAAEVRERLKDRLFVAHNAAFDYGFLKTEFKRIGLDFRADVLCTVKLSRRLYPEHKKHSLDSLIERHGLRADGRHRALADAQLIHQFWQRLNGQVEPALLDQAVRELAARPSLPPQVDASVLDRLPEGPGVYLFYGDDDRPLYVGRGSDVRKRVVAHFAADPAARDVQLAQDLRRIEWIETAGEIGAVLRETALIRALQPAHNRELRAGPDLCSWQLQDLGGGLWRPALLFARDTDFARGENLHGLFKNAREAAKVLAGVAAEYRLCPALLGLEHTAPGKPCLAHQSKRCKGACIGKESASMHSGRLMAALARMRLQAWPFPGPALLREGGEVHVLDRWAYLGTATSDEEIADLAARSSDAPFDPDSYKVLSKAAARLIACPRPA